MYQIEINEDNMYKLNGCYCNYIKNIQRYKKTLDDSLVQPSDNGENFTTQK